MRISRIAIQRQFLMLELWHRRDLGDAAPVARPARELSHGYRSLAAEGR